MNLLLMAAVFAVIIPFLHISYLPLMTLLTLLLYLFLYKKVKIIKLALSLGIIIFIYFNSLGMRNHVEQLHNYMQEGEVELSLVVKEESNNFIRARILTIDGNVIEGRDNLLIYTEISLPKGTILHYVGSIRQFRQFKNPGTYSPFNIYRYRTYGYITENTGQINVVEIKNSESKTSTTRNLVSKRLSSLSPESSALALGILLGDRSQLDSIRIQDFKNSGLIHITTVSGLHVGIVFMVFRFFSKPFLAKKYSILLGYCGAILFTLLVGYRPSTVRAIMMLGIYSFAEIKGYPYSLARSLQVAALINIIYNPFVVLDIGFQFSYLAVFGIVYLAPKLKFFNKIPSKYLSNMLKITVSIQVILLPLNFLYNKGMPILTPVANLLIAPVLSPYLAMLMIFVLFPLSLVKIPIELISYYILNISKITSLWVTLNNLILVLMVVSIGIWAIWKLCRSNKVKWSLISLLFIFLTIFYVSQPVLQIHFLDVGQGDCIIIQYKSYTLMIDTGGIMGVDIANRVLAPTFSSLGINKIDYLFITHPHYDHFGALGDMLDIVKIERLLFPDHEIMFTSTFMSTLQKAQQYPIEIIPIKKGDELQLGPLTKKIFHPSVNFIPSQSPANNISLVTLLTYKDVSVLFTGDIEAEAEKYILESLVSVNFLKVAHHGSGTSTLSDFLDTVSPNYAIISVGVNRYGHPSPDLLKRFAKRNIATYTTQGDGMITINVYRNGNYSIRSYRRRSNVSLFGFW